MKLKIKNDIKRKKIASFYVGAASIVVRAIMAFTYDVLYSYTIKIPLRTVEGIKSGKDKRGRENTCHHKF